MRKILSLVTIICLILLLTIIFHNRYSENDLPNTTSISITLVVILFGLTILNTRKVK